MPPEFKALALGSLRMKDVETEARATNHCLELLTHYRDKMGWVSEGQYREGSWLWKRHIATRMFEGDYSHRKKPGTIYEVSNMSLNMPKDFIDMHKGRISDDLLGGDEFFGTQPEGPEDQHPANKLFERYLQRRAKQISLRERLNEAVKGTLIRGETIAKTTRKRSVATQKREVRIVLQPTGEAARDSRGNFITELDEWVANPENPATELLKRDPIITRKIGGETIYSPTKHPIMASVESIGGADIAIPYWADVVFDVTAEHLQRSFFAHIYELYPDEVMDMLSPSLRTPEAEVWYKKKIEGGSNPGPRSDQSKEVAARGEDMETTGFGDKMTFAPVLIAECYFQADLDGDGKRERCCYVVDLHDKGPITYDYAHAVMPWAPERANPATGIRINPIEKKIYGIGYYDELADAHGYCDRNYNRLEVEISKSGNLLFEDREATEEGKAQIPLRFRTMQTYKKRGDGNGKEPVTVVTVTPQTAEIDAALDRTLQRLQTAKGMVTPANAEQAGLDAANTATGMELLQKTADIGLKAREAELMVGFDEVLGDLAQIEVGDMNWSLAEEVFRPITAEMEAKEEDPNEPGTVRKPPLEELKEWVAQNEKNVRSRVKIVMARKSPTQLAEQNRQIDEIMDRWYSYPPEIQASRKDDFAARLRALDVQNPEAMLITLKANPQAPNGSDPERQATAA